MFMLTILFWGEIRNKIKGLGQGFRNNKKIVHELGTKLKDQDRDLGTIKRLFRNQGQKYRIRTEI